MYTYSCIFKRKTHQTDVIMMIATKKKYNTNNNNKRKASCLVACISISLSLTYTYVHTRIYELYMKQRRRLDVSKFKGLLTILET